MKITRENIDNVNAVVKVLIEKADYEKTVADTLRDYRQKAALPGFRPGKAPASLIQKRFGKAILAEEVNKLLSQNLNNFLIDQKLAILGEPLPNEELQPKIDWDNDTDYEFVFDIALAPEVKLDLENGNAFNYYRIKVDDQMLEDNLEEVRMRFGQNKPGELTEEKSLVRGNFVQLDAEGNELADGIKPENVLLAIDYIKDENIKKDFIGRKIGETLTFDPVTAFENRHEVGHMLNISHEEADKLDGNFNFTITEIENFEKAELNEELYKKIYGEETEITTLEQFKAKMAEEIAGTLAHSSNQKFALDARDTLVESTDLSLPEKFLKRWLKVTNKELTEEQIEGDFVNFSNDLKWQLIKNSIIRDNELKVTEEETVDLAKQVALSQYQQYGIYHIPDERLDAFAKMILEREEERERIVRKLFEDKVIEVVKEKVTIVEKEVTSEEFREMLKQ